jgi:tetratricopeptide (TPR) repeat protein
VPIEIIPVTRYARQDVLRILRLNPRQLVAWEKAGLIAASHEYSFENLVQLRKLRDLRATRISSKSIRASVDAMQRCSGMVNPMLEASAVMRGSRVAFRHGGALVDPVRQQLIFDFDSVAHAELSIVGAPAPARTPTLPERQAQAQEMFLRAVQLEENPATLREAVALYEEILVVLPTHAPSCINLGTIHYNQRLYRQAEGFYRRATEADPEYALAFFDLGNVLDELQRLGDAIVAYQTAIKLVPQYADAHYNLALALERKGEKRRALRHWLMYMRLDPVGPWAGHAKAQARKIMSNERLRIVTRPGRTMQQHVAAG